MASGLQSYTATFSGDFASYIGGKVVDAAKNAKQEKENQKKAEELGIEVPAEEKKGLFKKALLYEFGGRRFDRTVGPFLKSRTSKQVSSKSTFSDKFSYTDQLKKSKPKSSSGGSPIGGTTTKKGSGGGGGRFSFTRGFGELSLSLEQLNNKVSSLVSVANKQLGATYRTSGGIAGVQKILAEQNNLQKESIEDAKSAGEEASMDQTQNVSGSDVYKSSLDQTPGWDDETGQPIAPAGGGIGVPDGDGDGGGGGLLDVIDSIDDINDLRKQRNGRGLRGRETTPRTNKPFNPFKRGSEAPSAAPSAKPGGGLKLPRMPKGIRGGPAILAPLFAGFEFAGRKSEGQTNVQAGVGTAGSVAGGVAGGWAGAQGGAAAGAAIGALFGGVGAVPGAVIGGLLGGLAGGFGGSMVGGGLADAATGANKKMAEGGVMPLSSRKAQNLFSGTSPAVSAMSSMTGGGNQDAVKEASQLPFKAIGGAILSITDGFVKALGPVAGVVAPMIKQEVSPLARVLGMPSSLAKFGGVGGGGLQSSPQAMKQGMDFMKNFMEGALEKLGIKPKKEEEKTTSSGSSGSSGSSSAADDASTEGETPSASPAAAAGSPAPAPGMRSMTGDEYAAKVTKEVKGQVVRTENLRGGRSKNIYGVTDARLAVVKNSENGSPTPYYHDTFGQLYKMNSNDGKVTRVTQDEMTAAQSIAQTGGDFATGAWHFFRKPDKNVVLGRLQSMPVGSVKLATKEIVYEEQSGRSGKTKKLRQPSEDEKSKYGIDSIKSPYGAASTAVPQVQAAAGASIITKLGDGSKLASAPAGRCVTGVLETMAANNVPNPQGTGNDGNNPRGLAAQLIKSYGWGSISGLGEKINLKSPYGNVGANAMSFSQWKDAVKSNKIPSGAIIFTTRNSDWSGNSSGGHDAAIAKSGGKKLWSGHWQAQVDGVGAVYGNASNKIIALTPGGQQIPYDGSTSGDSGPDGQTDSGQQTPTDPMEAFQQSVLGAFTGVQQLAGLASGKKWEDVKDVNQGKSFADIFNPQQTPDPAAGTTAPPPKANPPSGTAANVTPNQTTPAAAARPASSQASPNAAQLASAVTGKPSQMVPMPLASTTPGGSGSFHVKSSDFGTAENLRPQLASYIG